MLAVTVAVPRLCRRSATARTQRHLLVGRRCLRALRRNIPVVTATTRCPEADSRPAPRDRTVNYGL
jgi:hypothetical protein